jgi:hypothetical protein
MEIKNSEHILYVYNFLAKRDNIYHTDQELYN